MTKIIKSSLLASALLIGANASANDLNTNNDINVQAKLSTNSIIDGEYLGKHLKTIEMTKTAGNGYLDIFVAKLDDDRYSQKIIMGDTYKFNTDIDILRTSIEYNYFLPKNIKDINGDNITVALQVYNDNVDTITNSTDGRGITVRKDFNTNYLKATIKNEFEDNKIYYTYDLTNSTYKNYGFEAELYSENLENLEYSLKFGRNWNETEIYNYALLSGETDLTLINKSMLSLYVDGLINDKDIDSKKINIGLKLYF